MRRLRLSLALAALLAGCSAVPLLHQRATEQWAFSAPWDPRSAASIRAHGAMLDGTVTDWIALDTLTLMPGSPYEDSLARVLAPDTRRMALLTSWQVDRFRPDLIRRLAADSALLARSARAVASRLSSGGYHGLVIDFEELTTRDTALTRAVVGAYARAAKAAGADPVFVAVPATDTSAYSARLFTSADFLVVMLYDEHWSGSSPGPVASPEWVRRSLAMRVAEGGAARLVAALPLYGYQWRPGKATRTISFDEARRLTTEAGVALDRDPATATLHALRSGSDGWELWIPDAVLADTLRREAASLGVRHIAYWRLGLEDAALWTTLRR